MPDPAVMPALARLPRWLADRYVAAERELAAEGGQAVSGPGLMAGAVAPR